ncbi:MAG: hypothetical protein IQL11_01415, partial [Bacteroidales bacterium]|nr:hypothetical protein [Bacteroidales bacterium]
MIKKLSVVLVSVLTLTVYGQDISEEALLQAMHTITSHDLLEYVKIQCDDKYQGRLTGTKEYQECAEWLAGELSGWGVSPAGNNGSWFQWFSIPYTVVLPDCGLSLQVPLKNGGKVLKQYKYITE